ncbi:hypothetical protein LWI28_026444 [Acer negundo]|uniref:BHLH domain-containing protein n=1 Tax=Acer negundo TaxID=4023 RepID=A0AAD5I7M3_ACENE|nr:hypothetical protein LWI28_026444 [Acer negundo]KAK4834682.1 hypothetical protein QYF36_026788 [Acer negundo]
MGTTTALRQLLKSFCTNLPWNYAVLWKLRHENQMILSWEDGCCDYPKPRETVEIFSEDICSTGNNEISSSNWETRVNNRNSGGYSIGLMVANMSHLQYNLGEGVVGKVADTGNHFWFSCDNVSTGKVNSKLIPNCPEEWLLQLASGIKTVLLVPVFPYGVIQLGSLELIAEDLAVVAYIKGRFTVQDYGYAVPFTSERDIQTQSSFTLMSGFMDNFDEPSASTIGPVKSEHSETVDSVELSEYLLSTLDQFVPLINFQGASGQDLSGDFRKESENKIGFSLVGLNEVSKSLSQSIDDSNLELMESKLIELSCLEEELEAYFQHNKRKLEVLGESYNGAMSSYPAGCSTEQPFEDQISSAMGFENSINFVSFPEDCELHKALGQTFQRHDGEYLMDSLFSVDNTHRADRIESAWFGKGGDTGYLLEAVVANGYSGSDDNSSDMCNSIKSSLTSLGQITAATVTQTESMADAVFEDDSIPRSRVASACVAMGIDEFTPALASFESTMDVFTNGEQLGKGYNNTQPRKGIKLSSVSKRRAKPSDNQKPRPRDRQLIQDRIKELRELVPNSVKCSIDGLLGRTIDHMLYLRNVTNQAEKLRQWVHHEVAARKDLRSSKTNDNSKSGKTWAFEFGNEHLLCPIVVEDLVYPGHMLIEMLCNDHGLFLEIAQVIRSLDLTILKGVMESRPNDTWAHFIVEASKGFHRVDIFWPLMHLLQHKRNPISSKI